MQFFLSRRIVSNHVFKISPSTIAYDCMHINECVPCSGTPNLANISKCLNRTYSYLFGPNLANNNTIVSYKKNGLSLNMSTAVSKPTLSPVLRLGEYDCVGFDLDNTLCEYNISSSIEMEYNVLATFLVENKGYDPNYMLKPLDNYSLDFLQRGLVVDFAHGNLLKLGENGIICKASHGTKLMSDDEIINTYGTGKTWEVTSEFSKNILVAWNGPLSERMRPLLDYFDLPASLAFARIIDSLDQKLGKPADIYNVWPDVLAGLQYMYKRENFIGNEGYFQQFKSNPRKFIKKCNPAVLDWLKNMRKSKITFLITGSNCDFASMTAETCLGKDWRSLFDIVICFARKPGFFTGCRPFIELDGFEETNPMNGNALEIGKIYSQGNWQELYQLFGKRTGKKEPKCLYFGDNLIQDVYAPSKYTKCDTVAVVEELTVENIEKPIGNLSETILSSKCWGSYFFDYEKQLNTIWGGIIHNYSKLCIPNLSVIAEYSTDHAFSTFYKGPTHGYFPTTPAVAETIKKASAV